MGQRLAILESVLQLQTSRNEQLSQVVQSHQQRTDMAEHSLRMVSEQINMLGASTAPAAAARAAAPAMIPRMVSAVDTRTIGKPKSFDGKQESWREFRFIFEAFGGAAHMALADMMLNAEPMGGAPLALSDLDLENQSMAKQL